MKKVKQKIGNIIAVAVVVLMVAFVAVLFYGKATNRPVYLFGKTAVWIITGSMEPEIERQSYVLVEQINPADVEVGDVILFYSDAPELAGSMNTHRVIEIIGNNEEFVTKGDNNVVKDEYTAKADRVVGRYIRVLPVLTAFMRLFVKPIGFFLLIIFVIVVNVLAFLPDIKKYLNGKNEKDRLEKEALMARKMEEELEALRKSGLTPNDKNDEAAGDGDSDKT